MHHRWAAAIAAVMDRAAAAGAAGQPTENEKREGDKPGNSHV
jgi:hypothetical protein